VDNKTLKLRNITCGIIDYQPNTRDVSCASGVEMAPKDYVCDKKLELNVVTMADNGSICEKTDIDKRRDIIGRNMVAQGHRK